MNGTVKSKMKQDGKLQKKQRRHKTVQLFKQKKKKSEEDAAIQYLQAQYGKVS